MTKLSVSSFNWQELSQENILIDPLLPPLIQSSEPVSLAVLTKSLIKDLLKYQPPSYNPAQNYTLGDLLVLDDGRTVRLVQVTPGCNPIQGDFQILTFAEPGVPRLVSGLSNSFADSPSSVDDALSETEIEDHARDIYRSEAGSHLRKTIRQVLQADERCIDFADEWWLIEKLPFVVTNDELEMVRQLLQEHLSEQSDVLPTISSEDLVELLWNVVPDDIADMRVATFSLNCALARQPDFCYLRVGGWTLTEQMPAFQISRQPHVPRIRSRVLAEASTQTEAETQLEAEQGLLQVLEDSDSEEPASQQVSTDPNLWQDLGYWRQTLAWPETKVKILGQHYFQGFLPLSKKGLDRVIPPSQNDIELGSFIFLKPDNIEDRISITIDYQQKMVVGGTMLQEYLASQGILPGCYLYIHRRSDTEFDIYPKLLSNPVDVGCKFAWIDQNGQLVTETETVQVQYEHDPQYIVSETRLEDMAALWQEATELGLSFFDILVMRVFPKFAPKNEAVHWKKLWEATFFGYRMGSQQAIQRELRRQCFVPLGDGYYRFEPERGYSFPQKITKKKKPTRTTSFTDTTKDTSKETILDQPTTEQPVIVDFDNEFAQIQNIVCSSLVGKIIPTPTGRPNHILEANHKEITVRTQKSKDRVQWSWIRDVYKALVDLGQIERKDVQQGKYRSQGGFRSAFIFGLLSKFAHIEQTQKPRVRLIYHKPQTDIRLRELADQSDISTVEGKPTSTAHSVSPSMSSFEKTRSGQLVAVDLVPTGPLFDTSPKTTSTSQPATITWAELAKMEAKYLIPGPSPLGRILNYVRRVKEGTYKTVRRGPREADNLNQWTIYAMVGLGLVQRLEKTDNILHLTPIGEVIYPRLLVFDEFSETEDSATIGSIRSQIRGQDEELYDLLTDNFLNSPSLQVLLTYLRTRDLPLRLKDFYTQFAEFCPEMTKVTIEHRIPGLLRVAEFCEVIGWDLGHRLILNTFCTTPMTSISMMEEKPEFIKSSQPAVRDDFPQVTNEETKSLSVPRFKFSASPAERAKLIAESKNLAEAFITSHQPLNSVAYTASYLGHFITARLSATSPQTQSDVVHDLLAYLGEQMLELNEEDRNLQDNFRLDLGGYLSKKQLNKINFLYTPKKPPEEGIKNFDIKLNNYHQAVKLAQAQLQDLADDTLHLGDFWRLNRMQWIWLLKQNLGNVDNMNNLVAVHQKYHKNLAELMRRLQRTDWLIDQIDYQLSDHTDEEIK